MSHDLSQIGKDRTIAGSSTLLLSDADSFTQIAGYPEKPEEIDYIISQVVCKNMGFRQS